MTGIISVCGFRSSESRGSVRLLLHRLMKVTCEFEGDVDTLCRFQVHCIGLNKYKLYFPFMARFMYSSAVHTSSAEVYFQ